MHVKRSGPLYENQMNIYHQLHSQALLQRNHQIGKARKDLSLHKHKTRRSQEKSISVPQGPKPLDPKALNGPDLVQSTHSPSVPSNVVRH